MVLSEYLASTGTLIALLGAFSTLVIANLRSSTRRLDARIDGVTEKFEEIHARFDRVDQRFTEVDQRFNAVDQRFKEIDQRFREVDARFDRIDQRFTEVDIKFERIDAQLTRIDHRFTDIDAKIDRFDAKFDAKFDATDAKFDRIDQRFDGVHDRFEGLSAQLSAVDLKHTNSIASLDARMTGEFSGLKEQIVGLRERVDHMDVTSSKRFARGEAQFDRLHQQIAEHLRHHNGSDPSRAG
ncbi:hypothetical protein [Leucobacter sp. 7(1)]|uniref:hypothetical protein n=1 Tax=Leucobacter sp. 7(1) TaxID=1255613 RepID=UPI000B361A70|nr:hypothetical protein [Leucobacter sp. 7(1)]